MTRRFRLGVIGLFADRSLLVRVGPSLALGRSPILRRDGAVNGLLAITGSIGPEIRRFADRAAHGGRGLHRRGDPGAGAPVAGAGSRANGF